MKSSASIQFGRKPGRQNRKLRSVYDATTNFKSCTISNMQKGVITAETVSGIFLVELLKKV